MSMAPSEAAETNSTLGSLCADLGTDILEIVEAPEGVSVRIGALRIRDPDPRIPHESQPGDLLLAVGVPLEPKALRPVLLEAGTGGAAAVVVRSPGSLPPGLFELTRESKVALVAVAAELTWERLYDLIKAAMAVDSDLSVPRRGSDPGASDLFALADATAELAGGPVSIEDTHSRVLAFSRGGQDVDPGRAATILHRHVPQKLLDEMRRVQFLKRMHSSVDPLTIELEGLEQRRVIAIHGGGEVLGSIWLAGDPGRLSPTADETLRGAARIAAVQLMRRNVMDDVERRLRDGRLQALLRGEPAGEGVLSDLSLDVERGLVVAAIQVGGPAAANAVALHDRLSGLLRVHLSAYRRSAAVTVMAGRVYAVVGCRSPEDRDRLRQSLQDGLKRAESVLGEPLQGGLGLWHPTDTGLAEIRQSADEALELGSEPGRVIPFEKVHARALLAEVKRFAASREPHLSPELELLLKQDEEHGTDYVRTLRAYFDALGDSREAARQLGVHANTVRYRVRRARELTGIDLGDGEARFAFELQLRLLPPADVPAGHEPPGR